MVKNMPEMWETQVQSPEDPVKRGMAIHSSILGWRTPWTGEPGLAGYSPWSNKELDMTEQLTAYIE